MKWALIVAFSLLLAPATRAAPLDPAKARLDPAVCARATLGDPNHERAEVEAVTRDIDTRHKVELAVIEARPPGEAADQAFEAAEFAYQRARFNQLYPLAEAGNAYAIYRLSYQYLWAKTDFLDEAEGRRLQVCAGDLGDPEAATQVMIVHWHAMKGSPETMRAEREAALDRVPHAAERGGLDALQAVGVYVGGGRHIYPQDPALGRRILILCARAGNDMCRSRLVDPSLEVFGFTLQDPVAAYLLLASLADPQPERFAKRRDAMRAALTPDQLGRAAREAGMWKPVGWAGIKDQWPALRAEILTRDRPDLVVNCELGLPCGTPYVKTATALALPR